MNTEVEYPLYHYAPQEDIVRAMERRNREARKTLRKQSAGLVKSMEEWGIEGMEAEFNGSGDSGEVESAWLVSFNEKATDKLREHLQDDSLQVWDEIDDEQEFFRNMTPSEFPLGEEDGCDAPPGEVIERLKSAMVDFTYAALAANRAGWEIDDGAYGTLRLTAKGQVTCRFTQRYTAEEDNSFDYQYKDEDDDE